MDASRRNFLRESALWAGGSALAVAARAADGDAPAGKAATGAAPAPGQRLERGKRNAPNILLIESDDHLWEALGCMGDPVIKTPNIDALAARGVVFRYNVCQGAECAPSRHSLLTASYPHNNGLYSNACKVVHPDQWTFPAALQRTGYHTALIGKNHFRSRVTGGAEKKDMADPEQIAGWKTYGFDDVHAVSGKVAAALGWNECPYRAYLRSKNLLEVHEDDYTKNRYEGKKSKRDYVGASPLKEEDTHDAFIADLFVRWIEAYQDDKPFMAWVDFVAPHPPADAPEPYASMYQAGQMRDSLPPVTGKMPAELQARATASSRGDTPEMMRRFRAAYYGMITLLDTQVGRMIQALERRGALENTVIVFVGDQGSQIGDHGLWGKGTMFRGSINSPLVIAWPRRFKQGLVIQQPVEMQDLAPTFLELAGARPLERVYCHGHSLLPLLTGEGQYERQYAFAEKLSTKMVATAEHKLMYDPNWDTQVLFDLKKDPDETTNVYGQPEYAAVAADLKDRILAWLAGDFRHANTARPKPAPAEGPPPKGKPQPAAPEEEPGE